MHLVAGLSGCKANNIGLFWGLFKEKGGGIILKFFPRISADSGLANNACQKFFPDVSLMRVGNPQG
jgi:hypothetical protein